MSTGTEGLHPLDFYFSDTELGEIVDEQERLCQELRMGEHAVRDFMTDDELAAVETHIATCEEVRHLPARDSDFE